MRPDEHANVGKRRHATQRLNPTPHEPDLSPGAEIDAVDPTNRTNGFAGSRPTFAQNAARDVGCRLNQHGIARR